MRVYRYALCVLSLVVLILILNIVPVQAAAKVSTGSSVSGVSLEGLTYSEAKDKLTEAVNEWLAEDDLLAKSEYEHIYIPRDTFHFDIDATLKELEEETRRHWSRFFKRKENVALSLKVTIKDDGQFSSWPKRINTDETLQRLITVAENLASQPVKIAYDKKVDTDIETVAKVRLPIKKLSRTDLLYMTDSVKGFVVKPNDTFSFKDVISLPEQFDQSTAEMNFLATAFYALFLQTNAQIVERHSQGVETLYEKPGVEAEVRAEKDADLIISNPNDYAYHVNADIDGDHVELTLQSFSSPYTYTYKLENNRKIKPRTIYRYSRDLSPGEKVTLEAGKDGRKVDVYRETYSKEGGFVDKELISRDYYPASPTIVLIPIQEETNDEESIEEEMANEVEQIDTSLASNDDVMSLYDHLRNESEGENSDLYDLFKEEYCTKEDVDEEGNKIDPHPLCNEDNEQWNQWMFPFLLLEAVNKMPELFDDPEGEGDLYPEQDKKKSDKNKKEVKQ
ncbi:MAG TPA: G5 domain-containing protein [Cerasibacillus sp.]|uniref:G5 domain-containing protein n=1 Tax=Cerasibacillus sp. TaxID=2498711 RepID=UPI002F3F39BA